MGLFHKHHDLVAGQQVKVDKDTAAPTPNWGDLTITSPAAGSVTVEVPDVQPGEYTVAVSNDDPITTYSKPIALRRSQRD
jgi:hypothetical protein